MNHPLAFKNVGKRVAWKIRVLFFDPTELYSRIKIDKYARTQKIPMREMFPRKGKLCRCGCKKRLYGRRTSWATNDCSKFAGHVHAIITGHSRIIRMFLQIYHEWECKECGDSSEVKMDHIVGVAHGGGGCWLSNFQLLCHTHHVQKTNEDFGRKPGGGISGSNQLTDNKQRIFRV